MTEGFSQSNLIKLGSVLICSGIFIGSVYLIDNTRFNRILYYTGRSLSNSQIGKLFPAETMSDTFLLLAGVIFTGFICLLLFVFYHRNKNDLTKPEKIFWLTNIIFIYLLVFPFFDVDLVVRFIIFIPIPVIINLIYFLKLLKRNWIKNALVGIFLMVTITMTFGEIMGVVMRNENNRLIQTEIRTIQNKNIFQPNDFVITKYSINPMCNWFFETKAGLITSLNKNDFKNHPRVFILNPKEGPNTPEIIIELTKLTASNEAEKYEIMRNNILIPKNAKMIIETDAIEIYELKKPPLEWKYDSNGNWIGY
jgi:hypothetical protein